MKRLALLFALCLALLLSACSSPAASGTPSPSPSSSALEEETPGVLSSFTAVDLEGNDITQSVLEGHTLTMVNVWATFCTPCIGEMPDLGELAAEYEEKGVQIIGLVSDVLDAEGAVDEDQLSLAQDIVEQTGANYLHIIPGSDLYPLLYQITSVPTTFFVDETGTQVGYTYLGAKEKEDWQAILDDLLEEVAP